MGGGRGEDGKEEREDGRGREDGRMGGGWEEVGGEGWEGGEGRILNSSAPPHSVHVSGCNFVTLQYLDVALVGISIGNEILQRFIVGVIDLGEQNIHRCRKESHMWQSRVEIEDYSVAYFDRIAAFKAPYC